MEEVSLIGLLTSRNNGFDNLDTGELESAKVVARIESYDGKISKLLDDKDNKTQKNATKGSHLIFKAYL